LSPGGSCNVTVVFSPTITGPQSFDLLFLLELASGSTGIGANLSNATLLISGNGLAMGSVPGFSASPPTNVVFANQTVGTTSAAQTVTITNTGNAPMIFTLPTFATNSDYSLVDKCPLTPLALGVGMSCTVDITITPTHVGVDNGVLQFTTNASTAGQSLSLFGIGLAATTPVFASSPPSLTFPRSKSARHPPRKRLLSRIQAAVL